MFGWSISASACRSASKRARTCRLSMPGLDELQRDLAAHRLGLLGHVDRAHAPFADRLEQLVRADHRARACSCIRWLISGRRAAVPRTRPEGCPASCALSRDSTS